HDALPIYRVLERTGEGRQRKGDQENGEREAAQTVEDIAKHWTTPAEGKRRRRHAAFFVLSFSRQCGGHEPQIRCPRRGTWWSLRYSYHTSSRPSRRSGPWSLPVPSTRHRRRQGPGSS